ncbi:MAG: hypothetical protein QXD19_00170 [Candidatus Bathyarchaeia archaeon]
MAEKRDTRGRFVKGTKPGPGRPRKTIAAAADTQLWSYQALRDAWLTFRLAQRYHQLDVLKCRCGNDDPLQFGYKLSAGKFRAQCKKCGYWNDFNETHGWYTEPLMFKLTREERALLAMHRKGTFTA